MSNNGVNNDGWFAVSRMIFDHHMIGIHNRAYTKFEAWLWMCGNANWRERTITVKGTEMTLCRGDLLGARSYLASVWKWTPKQVRGFLDKLEAADMAKRTIPNQGTDQGQKKGHLPNVLTICNYAHFQDQTGFEGHLNGHTEGHQRATKGPHPNHGTIKPEESTPTETPEASLRQVVWEKGKVLLANGSRDPKYMGGIIGKAIKQTDIGITLEALIAVEREHPADPVGYFNGIIKKKASGKPKNEQGHFAVANDGVKRG